jgi:outer membrane biosynthesis protein TonB
MEPLKKIVKNQYFPAAAVLTAVVLFWVIAMFGGLSLLNNNQPPMATLTWMLFVYAAAVLTPLAGVLAAVNLVRRWQRNRQYAQALAEAGIPGEAGAANEFAVPEEAASADEPETAVEPVSVAEPEPASVQREQPRPSLHSRPVPQQPAQHQPKSQPAQHQPKSQPLQKHQPKSQPLKKQGQAKQRKKAA